MSNQRTKWTQGQYLDWCAKNAITPVAPVFRDAQAQGIEESPRIRQSHKPIMNKLEMRFHDHLRLVLHPGATIWPQAWSSRLGNGANYRPDFLVLANWKIIAYECKGPRGVRGASKGLMTLKIAASIYPQIDWFLVERVKDRWIITPVLP